MCKHDEATTEEFCLMSPAHHTFDGAPPDKAISRFVENVVEQYNKHVKDLVKQTRKYLDDPTQEDKYVSFDLYGADLHTDTLFIFFHGGYWQFGDKTWAAPVVNTLLDANVAVASVGYILAKPGRPIMHLVNDCATAIDKIAELYPQFTRIVVGGSSAGAHLAYKSVPQTTTDKIVGIVGIAGAYDLREFPDTKIGKDMGLTKEDAEESSCKGDEYNTARSNCKLLFAVGSFEAPKLVDATVHLVERLKKNHIKATLQTVEGEDHFTILENIKNPESKMSKLLVDFCKKTEG